MNTGRSAKKHVQDTSGMYTAQKVGVSPRAVVLFKFFLVWLCAQSVAAGSALDCETQGVKGSEVDLSQGGRCEMGTYLR